MKVRKNIISFLLIFAYSIGFAHEMIPHFHLEDGIGNHLEVSIETHHHHHHLGNHKQVNTNDGNNIVHEDHQDDSLYDYLVCLLSAANHTASYSSLDASFPSFEVDHFENQCNKNVIVNSSFFVNEAEVSCLKVDFFTSDECDYLSPITESDPNRGPPIFPC